MTTPRQPKVEQDAGDTLPPEEDKPGTNEVQHRPNPRAEPVPGVDHKYQPRSPYTTGND